MVPIQVRSREAKSNQMGIIDDSFVKTMFFFYLATILGSYTRPCVAPHILIPTGSSVYVVIGALNGSDIDAGDRFTNFNPRHIFALRTWRRPWQTQARKPRIDFNDNYIISLGYMDFAYPPIRLLWQRW
jgi:hypothetical protein